MHRSRNLKRAYFEEATVRNSAIIVMELQTTEINADILYTGVNSEKQPERNGENIRWQYYNNCDESDQMHSFGYCEASSG